MSAPHEKSNGLMAEQASISAIINSNRQCKKKFVHVLDHLTTAFEAVSPFPINSQITCSVVWDIYLSARSIHNVTCRMEQYVLMR